MSTDWSIINVDDSFGVRFGFTSKRFKASSFISVRGSEVKLTFVLPRQEVYKEALIEVLKDAGFSIISDHL